MLYPAELQALPQPRKVRLAQGFNLCLGRMLKRFASGVLASLRGSTLRGTPRIFEILKGLIRSPRFIVRANSPTKCGRYLLRAFARYGLDGRTF